MGRGIFIVRGSDQIERVWSLDNLLKQGCHDMGDGSLVIVIWGLSYTPQNLNHCVFCHAKTFGYLTTHNTLGGMNPASGSGGSH